MDTIYSVLLVVLLLSLLFGLFRIILGPTKADRILAAQLFGSVGSATLMLQAVLTENWGLLDVAMILAILASIALIAFVKLGDKKE